MSGSICVYGLWHLGCVTAACLAAEGFDVVGLDLDAERVAALQQSQPPIAEPGLAGLIRDGLASGRLSFTDDPGDALAQCETLWITLDTPVDDDDEADVESVRAQVDALVGHLNPATLVLVSSQLPVGFCTSLERAWSRTVPGLQVVYSPENLRLGQAIETFRHPERVVIGSGAHVDRDRVRELFAPFTNQIEWMSLQSAEMTKHALNGFLALSVAYANELARICERTGADASEVERGLRTDPRIGPRAYLAPGPPLAGGTLLRDVGILGRLARLHDVPAPVITGIRASNELHARWVREQVMRLLDGLPHPRVALLGLTYKPGTDTLRRSSSVELGRWLADQGVEVRAFDPAIRGHRPELGPIEAVEDMVSVFDAADVAVLATTWPEFRDVAADELLRRMRHPRLVDQAGFLSALGDDPRLLYVRAGRPTRSRG